MVCLYGIETIGNMPVYMFKDLQVHHIVSIASDYSKRLDNDNLITLCSEHHSMADRNIIDANTLMDIIRDINNKKDITII